MWNKYRNYAHYLHYWTSSRSPADKHILRILNADKIALMDSRHYMLRIRHKAVLLQRTSIIRNLLQMMPVTQMMRKKH